ncbi:c-type cytochrome [Planctomicrobium piriforme]|uniref:Putative heme-binding domain-containing protein n=1 Tax=Planctomicrobium piriforme TaxID=1576369 RepID=A0A1I3JZ09_9PLAN|nr:c-type cytochrome [Planctomicrobium piriforme]SFI65298.1 putative heme-binding domain-containing protein [Planctomicrobium piriforme]
MRYSVFIALAFASLFFVPCVNAAEQPSPAAAMRKLLESGRVPEQRLPTIVKMICERGNADDLNLILAQMLKENGWSDELRADALDWLAIAAVQRKVQPDGDTSGLTTLLKSKNLLIQKRAVTLAGLWKVASAETALAELAQDPKLPAALRRQSLQAIASLDREKATKLLTTLAASGKSFELRAMGAGVLASLNASDAATAAAKILQDAGPHDQPGPMLDAFLEQKDGSAALAAALKSNPPAKDVAKLLLRHIYSVGRTDAGLNQVLSEQAGINQSAPPPTKEEVAVMVADAAKSGDPVRGEAVFRRADLSCLNCHSVSKGGGQIGPDLSAIGSSSPVEYLVASILDPDQAIKEAYTTKVIATVDGKVLQGIIESRTADSLVLKDATGKQISVPLADIDEEIEGKSLMPKGLVNFMTHAEFLDLTAFLSELGKPGEYGIRSTQRMQRYRVLLQAPESLLQQVPTLTNYEDLVLESENWVAAYARVNGQLPLAELATKTGSPVVYLKGEIACSEAGPVTIQLKSTAGTTVWLDSQELGSAPQFNVELTPGVHAVIVRVDTTQQPDATLQIEVVRPAGSSAQFVVVDGQ